MCQREYGNDKYDRLNRASATGTDNGFNNKDFHINDVDYHTNLVRQIKLCKFILYRSKKCLNLINNLLTDQPT